MWTSIRRVHFRISCYYSILKLALVMCVICGLILYRTKLIVINKYYNEYINRKLPGTSKIVTDIDQNEINSDQKSQIFNALDSRLFDTKIRLPDSYHLKNLCKYPVLQPDDLNIADFVAHRRHLKCKEVFPNIIRFSDGILSVDQVLALKSYNSTVNCSYRGLHGALWPRIQHFDYLDIKWTTFGNRSLPITYSQFEVKCYLDIDVNNTKPVAIYKNAFAHIATDQRTIYTKSDNRLSIDIIGLDSTSLNMFRRHMPKTWNYFINEMKGFHLEGYNKVADNSMVNWLPVFTGMRYGNQSTDMPCAFSEYQKPLNLEAIPFIWNIFRDRGCVTMLNDDPMNYARGLFHYPPEEVNGFKKTPTDYYFRPWHVYQRKSQPNGVYTEFCFNDERYYKLQMKLIQQWIKKYKDTCHFSFSFFTDITHDNPNNLELMDDVVFDLLKTAFIRNQLNNTVLILMGDHGNRIEAIQYTYVGRIEERAPFFGIYFPKWFHDKFSNVVENLKYNKNRLTSNYDIYQTLKDIVDNKFDGLPDKRTKGISLFQKVPADRNCTSANIPENHCLCMEQTNQSTRLSPNQTWANNVVLEYTRFELKLFPRCYQILKIKFLTIEILTTNKMVKHGVRSQVPEFMIRLKEPDNKADHTIVYYQIEYQLLPTNVTAVIRLQHDRKHEKLFVNVKPLVISNMDHCSTWSDLVNFCACAAFAHM